MAFPLHGRTLPLSPAGTDLDSSGVRRPHAGRMTDDAASQAVKAMFERLFGRMPDELWGIGTAYDEVKTHMLGPGALLRSKTPTSCSRNSKA